MLCLRSRNHSTTAGFLAENSKKSDVVFCEFRSIIGIYYISLIRGLLLLTKRKVKILAKLFYACLWTETESRSINTQTTRPISSHLNEQAWSIKDLSIPGTFSCGTQRVIPNEQTSLIFSARVANNSAEFE